MALRNRLPILDHLVVWGLGLQGRVGYASVLWKHVIIYSLAVASLEKFDKLFCNYVDLERLFMVSM